MGKTLFLILASVSMGVSGQLCLKAGMDQVGLLSASGIGTAAQTALRVLTTPLVFLGLAFYALGAVFWLLVLSKLDLSLAYPMLALTYILIPLAAQFILGEQVPALRWLGVGIIFFGVMVVAQTG
jgi:undecaprenyl phosphate-alpha-L-ara4N flippase subunit ArnE